MGFGNIGWFQIVVVLIIVLLVFGTKRIRNLGGDLGGAIRDFRKSVSDDSAEGRKDEPEPTAEKPGWDDAADKDAVDGKKPID
jgi:sec-independent protein translocase protein TatA